MHESVLILIPARNEATVIGHTVALACRSVRAGDSVLVIDDGSTDNTGQMAERAGAGVARRPPGESSGRKGEALRWGLAHCPRREGEVVLILDADSVIDSAAVDSVRARFEAGAEAVQTFIEPVLTSDTPAAVMAACSTLAEQLLDDGWRVRLGWPVRLRGTGMAFRREVFESLIGQTVTDVEDVELSLLCCARGIRVQFVPEAVVRDPIADTAGAAARQRARWLRGQATVWRRHGGLIARLLLRGPAAWSLLASLLLKPRLALAALKLVLVVVSSLTPGLAPLAVIGLVALALDAAYAVASINVFLKHTGRRLSLGAFAAFALMWGRSLGLAVRARAGWLRARPQ